MFKWLKNLFSPETTKEILLNDIPVVETVEDKPAETKTEKPKRTATKKATTAKTTAAKKAPAAKTTEAPKKRGRKPKTES